MFYRPWAILKTEYEYTDCSNRVVSVQKFQVNGFTLWTEDFNGLSLDIHHRYGINSLLAKLITRYCKIKFSQDYEIFVKLLFRLEPKSKILYMGSGKIVDLKDTNLVDQGILEKGLVKTIIDEKSFNNGLNGR